ncbi:MAG: hypothetical protein IH624_00420 [Phycisphaerae bacterium]|nr:hypothetical protein [Phycisphaerae bacterium]
MPDYNDHNLTPVDPFHHVERLLSVSDRVARRKQEQRRRREKKNSRDAKEEQADAGVPAPPKESRQDDGHIDFCA